VKNKYMNGNIGHFFMRFRPHFRKYRLAVANFRT
jgi:hypothetical protein